MNSIAKILVSLVIVMMLPSCGDTGDWPKERFDSQRWRQTSEAGRYVFAKDLIEQKLLIGKTRQEVVDLLGAPSSESAVPPAIAYLIKTGGSGMTQVFALEVRLDGLRGEVTGVGIRGD